MFLVFGNGELQVQRFIDSDFMSDIDDRKSTSESLFICNGGAVMHVVRAPKINLILIYYVVRMNQDRFHRDLE